MFLANLNSSWAGQARKTWCASLHLVQAHSLCASGLAASTHMQRKAHIKVSANLSYPWQAMPGCLLERPYLSHCHVTGYQTPTGAAKMKNSQSIWTPWFMLRVCQSSSFLHHTKVKISRNLCLSTTKVFLGNKNSLKWVCPQGRWFSKICRRVIS